MEPPRGVFEMDFLKKISNITKKPENFLGVQENVAKELTSLLKLVYDHTKTAEPRHVNSEALPELIIKDFDEEQIWQELELQNDFRFNAIMFDAAKLAVQKEKLALSLIADTDEEEEDEDEKDESIADEWGNDDEIDSDRTDNEINDDDGGSNIDSEETNVQVQKRPKSTSVVDDRFFKLEELDAFLEQEDKKEANKGKKNNESDDQSDYDSDDVDLFGDLQGDEESQPKYSEFFAAPYGDKDSGDGIYKNDIESKNKDEENNYGEDNSDFNDEDDSGEEDLGPESNGLTNGKKRVRFDLSEDDGADIGTNEQVSNSNDLSVPDSIENKSQFEISQDRLRKKINHLEATALAEKPWHMKGEVSSALRPDNSLLEEVVDFEMATRPAPIFTEVTTLSLEAIIKARVAEGDYNDVCRVKKDAFVTKTLHKKLVLNEEKSKQSLADIYEQDYKKKLSEKEKMTVADTVEKEEFQLLRKEMAALFAKLDSLANYHYTPKPSAPELRVITNISAVHMEEVAPVATTSGNLLAPEEVKAKLKGDLMSKEERTATDKRRERRHKKLMQHYMAKGQVKKSALFSNTVPDFAKKSKKKDKLKKDVMKSKNVSEMKVMDGVKVTKSSTSFFSKLQDEVQKVKTVRGKGAQKSRQPHSHSGKSKSKKKGKALKSKKSAKGKSKT